MERLKSMKETLISCVQSQLANIGQANTEELGEAIDMIKDLEEAMYYHCKSERLKEEKEEHKKYPHYYTENPMIYYHHPEYLYNRDMDKGMGKMYYSDRQPRNSQGEFTSYEHGNRYYGDGSATPGGSGSRDFTEREVPFGFRDVREGRSPISRRMYMESKEMH